MSKSVRKLVAFILSVVLSFTVLPLCAFADEPAANDEPVTSDEPITTNGPVATDDFETTEKPETINEPTAADEPIDVDEPVTANLPLLTDYHSHLSFSDVFININDSATIAAVCSHVYQTTRSSVYTYHDAVRHELTVYMLYSCTKCHYSYQEIISETSSGHTWITTTTGLVHTYSNGQKYHSYDLVTHCYCTEIQRRDPVINVLCNCS